MRPMFPAEFDRLRDRLIVEYAAEHVKAGNWTANEAQEKSTKAIEDLLPQGLETPGVLLNIAENSEGVSVGHLWVALERQPGVGGGAWIYDIEVTENQRGKGYGQGLLRLAEEEVARHGIPTIGLNVFGKNKVARKLYESAGYEPVQIYMKKEIKPSES